MSDATDKPDTKPLPPFVRIADAAHTITTSRSNVYRLAALGHLEIRRLPGVGPRVPRASLEAYLARVS